MAERYLLVKGCCGCCSLRKGCIAIGITDLVSIVYTTIASNNIDY